MPKLRQNQLISTKYKAGIGSGKRNFNSRAVQGSGLKQNFRAIVMKSPLFILAIILFISFGCNQSKNSHSELNKKLIGKWGRLNEEPMWDIRKDSFYFIKPGVSCHYQLLGDTLIVDYPNKENSLNLGKIRIDADTLFMFDYVHDFTILSYRYKK